MWPDFCFHCFYLCTWMTVKVSSLAQPQGLFQGLGYMQKHFHPFKSPECCRTVFDRCRPDPSRVQQPVTLRHCEAFLFKTFCKLFWVLQLLKGYFNTHWKWMILNPKAIAYHTLPDGQLAPEQQPLPRLTSQANTPGCSNPFCFPPWMHKAFSEKRYLASGKNCWAQESPFWLGSLQPPIDSSWDLPVTAEIQMGFTPLWLVSITVHCAVVSTRASYFWGSDVAGHWIHISSTQNCPFLYLAGDRASWMK